MTSTLVSIKFYKKYARRFITVYSAQSSRNWISFLICHHSGSIYLSSKSDGAAMAGSKYLLLRLATSVTREICRKGLRCWTISNSNNPSSLYFFVKTRIRDQSIRNTTVHLPWWWKPRLICRGRNNSQYVSFPAWSTVILRFETFSERKRSIQPPEESF